MVIVPLNADGSALGPDLVAAITVVGATRMPVAPAGEPVLQAKPGATVHLSIDSWHATYSKPADVRVIPVKIDAPAHVADGKSKPLCT